MSINLWYAVVKSSTGGCVSTFIFMILEAELKIMITK